MTAPILRFKDQGRSYPDWVQKKLKDCVTFSKGGSLSKSDLSPHGATPCLLYGELYTTYGEVTKAVINKTDSTEDLVKSQMNDVILPMSGETAEDIAKATCIKQEGVAYGGDLMVLRSKSLDGCFLSYSLNSINRRQISRIAQGKTVVHINPSRVSDISINVACLEEQQKIAAFFTALDEKIQKTRKKLVLTLKLKRAFARDILTRKVGFSSSSDWQDFTLGDVSSIIKTRKSSDFLLYVGTEDLIKDFGGLNKVKKENVSGIYFEKDDILISNIRPYLKKLWMSDEEGIASTDVIVYRSKNIEPSLLKHILSTDSFFEHVAQGYKGSKMPRGDKSQMATFAFQIPSDEKEQKKIANFLNLIDKKITCLREQEKALKKQKQAFMQQMFV